jgi:phage portal protein BeeE
MEWHAGLAGNAYVFSNGKRLRILNPAWVTVVLGSHEDPGDALNAVDAEIIGYSYQPGGPGGQKKPRTMLAEEVAHWSPIPDPENPFVGMSWITPAVREIQGDVAAVDHKLKYFENGATPNLVVKGIPASSDEEFNRLVDLMEEEHAGIANAYRTLYLVNGADATVVGDGMQKTDLRSALSSGETRISILSRVPASILGIYDGLAGSSLNAGNFGQARRNFADGWLYPTLQSAAGALTPIVPVPHDAELWYATSDMPFIRDDATDQATIQQTQATTINAYVNNGFTPESAIAAVIANDPTQLVHTGLISVQLQKPGAEQPDAADDTTDPADPADPADDSADPAAA